jgi:hypothetical protein
MKNIFYENYISCNETPAPRGAFCTFTYLKVKEGRGFLMGRNCGMLFMIFEKSLDGGRDSMRYDAMRYDALQCDTI